MLDCGMHMGFNDERRFPDFSFVSGDEPGASLTSSLDCVIISHFHLGLSNYLKLIKGLNLCFVTSVSPLCVILLPIFLKV